MRCKRHPCAPGSVGVCASCLRERLLSLLAAQVKEAESGEDRRKSDPPPLAFPRSVSPYVCRQSVTDSWDHYRHHSLFYSTPQVGPTFSEKKKKKRNGPFSRLSSFFGVSRSEKKEREKQREKDPSRVPNGPSSSSWLSAFRKKKSRLFSLDDEICGTGDRRTCRMTDRGLSPTTRDEGEEEKGDGSPVGSGYSSESSKGRPKPVAVTTGSVPKRRTGSQHARNVSGLTFCLSPLVRASPNRHRHDTGFSGELRSANRHHWSAAPSLCANRSRKLADFGRYP
ncbi:uncharacterized protein LOC131248125 [Magnolia sinica]|uniref:uncharacterized protein LOC131248125 n=1 Tax=Magnolia sinica TaxID=86752 RepID=UPI00265994E7|nr:uncharacterized protein LOC131248125 [Magnolia sinica]